MSKYLVDTWAWIEYLRGTALGASAKDIIERGDSMTSVVTIAEVVSKFSREGLNTEDAFSSMTSLSKIIDVDRQLSKETGLLHSTVKKSKRNFSLADAFVLQTAKDLNIKVLTGDPDFEGIKETEMLKKGK